LVLLLFRKAHSQPQANPNSSPEAVRAQAWAASLFLPIVLSEPPASARTARIRIFRQNSLIIICVNPRLLRSATLDRLTAIQRSERLESPLSLGDASVVIRRFPRFL